MKSDSNPKAIVLAYLDAMNNHDFKAARGYLNNTLSATTPMGSCTTAEQFLKDAERTEATYKLKKVLADQSDVCLLFDTVTPKPPVPFLTCGWYHVQDGKINSVRLIFDASPFTAMSGK